MGAAITLVKALAYADQLRTAKWLAQYKGQPWDVDHMRLFKDGDELHMECVITCGVDEHRLVLAEHLIGGRDYLQLDGEKCDANHVIDVIPKGFPPSLKIKIKCYYDVDEETGYEEQLTLFTKVKQ
jgi:hypothetical protein